MPISCKLSVGGELRHGPALPACRVVLDVFENARLQDEKRTVYPSFAIIRLLTKTPYLLTIEIEITETSWLPYCRYSCKLAMRSMECKQTVKVDI